MEWAHSEHQILLSFVSGMPSDIKSKVNLGDQIISVHHPIIYSDLFSRMNQVQPLNLPCANHSHGLPRNTGASKAAAPAERLVQGPRPEMFIVCNISYCLWLCRLIISMRWCTAFKICITYSRHAIKQPGFENHLPMDQLHTSKVIFVDLHLHIVWSVIRAARVSRV